MSFFGPVHLRVPQPTLLWPGACFPAAERFFSALALCSWLTWGYLGWRGLVAVFAFFWAAGLAQRCGRPYN